MAGKKGCAKNAASCKKAAEALREPGEKYRRVFDEALDAIFLADAKTGVLVDCNKAACRLVGRKKPEIIGKHQGILHPPQDIKGGFSKTFKQHLKEKEGLVLEAKVITKKGKTRDVEIKANIFRLHGKEFLQGIFHDITTQKKTEKALKEAEEKYRLVVNSIEDILYSYTPDGKVTFISDNISRLGYSANDVLGHSLFEFVHPDDKKSVLSEFKKTMSTGKPSLTYFRLKKKNGSYLFVEELSRAVKKDGRIIMMSGIIRDITERMKAEEAIFKEKTFSSVIVENAPFGIMMITPNGGVDYVNPAMFEISGDSKANFKEMNVFKLPAYIELGLSEKIRKCFKGASFFIGPVAYVSHFSGKRTVRNFTGMPMRNEEGKVDKVMLFVEDITKIKETEENLRESEERFRAIFEGATEGILVADTKTKRFVFANPGICELTGYSSNELFKLNIEDIHPAKDLPYVMAQVARQIKGEITLASNIPVLRKDKQVVYCDVNSAVMKIGKLDYIVGFFRDITERKKADDELKKRSDELEKFNKMAVGRELRMIELKKRVKELESEAKRLRGKEGAK